MFCEKCGNKASDGASFCGSCGARLTSGEAPSTPSVHQEATPNIRPKKKVSVPIIILCSVFIIGVAAALLFFLKSGGNGGVDYTVCGANRCNNPVVGSYTRCSTHLYTCKVCGKQIGSLSYGYCNEHYPR